MERNTKDIARLAEGLGRATDILEALNKRTENNSELSGAVLQGLTELTKIVVAQGVRLTALENKVYNLESAAGITHD